MDEEIAELGTMEGWEKKKVDPIVDPSGQSTQRMTVEMQRKLEYYDEKEKKYDPREMTQHHGINTVLGDPELELIPIGILGGGMLSY